VIGLGEQQWRLHIGFKNINIHDQVNFYQAISEAVAG
jgi:hypothetical protein